MAAFLSGRGGRRAGPAGTPLCYYAPPPRQVRRTPGAGARKPAVSRGAKRSAYARAPLRVAANRKPNRKEITHANDDVLGAGGAVRRRRRRSRTTAAVAGGDEGV